MSSVVYTRIHHPHSHPLKLQHRISTHGILQVASYHPQQCAVSLSLPCQSPVLAVGDHIAYRPATVAVAASAHFIRHSHLRCILVLAEEVVKIQCRQKDGILSRVRDLEYSLAVSRPSWIATEMEINSRRATKYRPNVWQTKQPDVEIVGAMDT